MMRIALIGLLTVALATDPVVRTKEEVEAFRAYLTRTKTGHGDNFLGDTSLPENPEENGHFDGDIVLDDTMIDAMVNNFAQGKAAILDPVSKWPNNTVVYEFGEGEFGSLQEAAILRAIRDIESNTCIKFRRREAGEKDYVHVTGSDQHCYATVGYHPNLGVHSYNLESKFWQLGLLGIGCFSHGTIVHEWMHILGFYHMHSAYDRDNYVRIQYENVLDGFESNFFPLSSDSITNLGVDYDYTSCMHYGSRSASKNRKRTIVALKDFKGVMGQRWYIPDSDWKRINRHYNCPGAWD